MSNIAVWGCIIWIGVVTATARAGLTTLPTPKTEERLAVARAAGVWSDSMPARIDQVRVERLMRLIEQEPGKWDRIEEAASACDRLRRYGEAIALLEREQTIRRDEMTDDQRRRLSGRLGAIWFHQWAARADLRGSIGELRQARDLLQDAVSVDPAADETAAVHLALVRWLIDSYENPTKTWPAMLSAYVAGPDPSAEVIVKVLCEMAQSETSPGALDVCFWLTRELQHVGHGDLAMVAALRTSGLAASGQKSLSAFAAWINEKAGPLTDKLPYPSIDQEDWGRSYYRHLRNVASERERGRQAFIAAKLATGQHPDTHAQFWSGWTEPPIPVEPMPTLLQRWFSRDSIQMIGLLAVMGFGAFFFWLVSRPFLHLARA